MDLSSTMKSCDEYQHATDELWRKLLPLAGPHALRIFVVRSIFDAMETAPWLRHLRFFGDGRPVWASVAELPRRELALSSIVGEVLRAVAVKTIEQFGGMPERPWQHRASPR
jgi:hypothetical protein